MESTRQTTPKAFTLIELLVVIAMISLVMGVTLPSAIGIFSAGASSQAYNQLSAQLGVARALAVQRGAYAGVHVQLADPTARADLGGASYSAVMILKDVDPSSDVEMRFVLVDGFFPQQIPGRIAFGELSGDFVDGADYLSLPDNVLDDFTTFTIVFSPSGEAVRYRVRFHPNDDLFGSGSSSRLWNFSVADNEMSVTAVTMFSYMELLATAQNQRDEFLNRSGLFLPVNIYTGQLLPRK